MWQVVKEILEEVRDTPQENGWSVCPCKSSSEVITDILHERLSEAHRESPMLVHQILEQIVEVVRNAFPSAFFEPIWNLPLSDWRRDRGGGVDHSSGARATVFCGAAC